MAETTSPPAAPSRGLGGQPWWVWGAGGVALVGGFIYLRSKGSSAGASSTGTTATGTTSPTGLSADQLLLFLLDHQGPPAKTKTSTGKGAPPPHQHKKPAPKPKPRRKSSQPPLMSGTYTVKPGQTLASVARLFGISRVQLAHANGLGTGAGLRTGQKLHVPGPVKHPPG